MRGREPSYMRSFESPMQQTQCTGRRGGWATQWPMWEELSMAQESSAVCEPKELRWAQAIMWPWVYQWPRDLSTGSQRQNLLAVPRANSHWSVSHPHRAASWNLTQWKLLHPRNCQTQTRAKQAMSQSDSQDKMSL